MIILPVNECVFMPIQNKQLSPGSGRYKCIDYQPEKPKSFTGHADHGLTVKLTRGANRTCRPDQCH